MTEFLRSFFTFHDYPSEAIASLLSDYENLMAVDECREIFSKYLTEYEEQDRTNFGEFIVLAAKAGNAAAVDGRATQFLCFACAARHMKEIYKKRGLPLSVCDDTLRDLRYKLMECYKMYGVWGSFVASWFYGAFVLDRFEIGRLQFELSTHFATKEPYEKCGLRLVWDETPVINLHIPSSGPLRQSDCMDSYRAAYKFFEKYMPERLIDGKLVIECGSWLLYREHYKFLPEDSNIIKFMNDFEIVHSWDDPGFGDCWRIFNKGWDGDASALPRDTSLQRAYADWLADGNTAGEAHGIIIFDGEKIINK